jgi:hypothetical protein
VTPADPKKLGEIREHMKQHAQSMNETHGCSMTADAGKWRPSCDYRRSSSRSASLAPVARPVLSREWFSVPSPVRISCRKAQLAHAMLLQPGVDREIPMNQRTKWLAAGAGVAGAAYAAYVADTWLRYGQPRRARGGAKDALLDTFMPDYDVGERHEIAVAAPADETFAAAEEMELDSSPVVRALFRARDVILGSKPETTWRPKGLLEQMKSMGWGVLAERPGREIVVGGVTKPWEANPVFRALPPNEFAAFVEPDFVKIAWTLRASPEPSGGSTFSTETRAVATDARARRKFRVYWAFLSPGIILIRSAMLPLLKAAAERKWRVEGDDLLTARRSFWSLHER